MSNALERWLVRSLERSLNRPYNKPLQALRLLPRPTLPTVNLSLLFYVRSMFVFFAAFVVLGFVSLAVYFVYLVLNMFTLHQIQHHYHAMLHVAFMATKSEIIILCLTPFAAVFLSGAGLAPSFWAWNRRARRLSLEPVMPEPTPAVTPDVWPPPPRTMC